MKKLLSALSIALIALTVLPSQAVEITIERGNARSTIILSGPIEIGDAERFKAFWFENAYDSFGFTVSMDSPGGSLWDGIELGQFIRKVGADTKLQRYAPRTPDMSTFDYARSLPGAECYSACALAFMGGVEREIAEDASIGFHQFYGGGETSAEKTMMQTQNTSAVLSGYLRDMGATPELFEMMSMTSPEDMFIPTREQLATLGIIPASAFHSFRLMPKDGLIVATASNERNPGALERVYEIETLCWKGTPVINLYTTGPDRGLWPEYASRATTHIDGFSIETDFGTAQYGSANIKLYAESTILATLSIEPEVARAIGSGNAWIRVNSSTASGVFMTGEISAPPGGDPAILASFRECL